MIDPIMSTISQVGLETAPKKDAAGDFEGLMIEMMIKEMRKTIPEGIFSSSSVDLFSGVFDQELAKSIARSGGLGLSDSINGSITRNKNFGFAPFRGQPFPVSGKITSSFGERLDPFSKKQAFHKGIDIGAKKGSPIHSLAEGTVTSAHYSKGYGNVVEVKHADGWSTLYAHCNSLKVSVGDQIKKNQVLGTVGSTGKSTGPHLHLELKHNGKQVDPELAMGW